MWCDDHDWFDAHVEKFVISQWVAFKHWSGVIDKKKKKKKGKCWPDRLAYQKNFFSKEPKIEIKNEEERRGARS